MTIDEYAKLRQKRVNSFETVGELFDAIEKMREHNEDSW